jgi:hexosaminidase
MLTSPVAAENRPGAALSMEQVKIKNNILSCLAGLMLAGNFARATETAVPALIPWPAEFHQQAGEFSLNPQTVVVADPALASEAKILSTALNLPVASAAAANYVRLTTNGANQFGDEAYALEVSTTGVTIRARTPAGAFYGIQTLEALATARKLPCVKISDAPRYAWRGLMLDVSRHFFDQATVQHVLDWMAGYKLNRLHLHLTDDQGWRVEIQKFPGLTQAGARGNFSDSNAPARFFTREDLRAIVAYAAQRHIVVVPEIDMPGHASAATRTFPQFDGGEHTYNPANEETYAFLQSVLRDVMEIFPSPWIHFGGDEVNHSHWQVTEKLKNEGVQNPAQLEGYFVRRMSQFIAQQGRTPMGWDEIVSAQPATNTIVFWWRHNKPESLKQALTGGYSVVLTPRLPCYFDYPQDKSYPQIGWKICNTPAVVYAGPQLPENLSAAERKNILGVEGCVWTERIGSVPYLEFMLLPRLAALSEMAWTPDAGRDYAKFGARLKPRLEEYRQAGIHFYDDAHPQESLHAAQTPAGSTTASAK